MSTMTVVLGVVGDTLTFIGGAVLAWDAIRREREFQKRKDMVAGLQDLKDINFVQNGIPLINEMAAELVFVRQSVRRSKWGAGILTLGFIFLLCTRIVETAMGATGNHS
jgi:hypothetical protein